MTFLVAIGWCLPGSNNYSL